MFVINIPCTCSYDGADNISLPYLQFICSDRNLSGGAHTIIHKEYGTPTASGGGASVSQVAYEIYTALGYNPFSIINTYAANNTGDSGDITGHVAYILSALGAQYKYMPRNNTSSHFNNFKINGTTGDYTTNNSPANIYHDIGGTILNANTPNGQLSYYISSGNQNQIGGGLYQFGERFYDHGQFDTSVKGSNIVWQMYWALHPTTYEPMITYLDINIGNNTYSYSKMNNILAVPDLEPDIDKPNNPYITPGGESGDGGGDGGYADSDPETIDPTAIPDVPNISAITTGLITTYIPTITQVQALGNFMWSSAFDVSTWKKLFADPMQAIIGLGIIPISPTAAGTKSCKLGDVDTGVAMPYISNQFVQKSCGSVAIKKEVGCFMDYTDTDISIYLPYCGMHQLNTQDVMNDTVTVTYNIDVVSGGCTAIVSTAGKGVLYQFSGNCIANVPLTSINYSTAIQNAVSGAISIGGAALGAATGAAPLTAIGAAGLAKSAANIAMNKHGSVGRSGNMAGAAGLMAVQTPFMIITRPRRSVPKDLNKYTGYTYNVTMKLGQAVGFTMIDFIRLDSIPCTGSERDELYNLLQEGVIF